MDSGRHLNVCHEYLSYLDNGRLSHRERLDEQRLQLLIQEMRQQQCWQESTALLYDYLQRFPDESDRARLMQAATLVRELNRPKRALAAMASIDPHHMGWQNVELLRRIQRAALQQVEAGVLEPASVWPVRMRTAWRKVYLP